jgi:hypothetical protein
MVPFLYGVAACASLTTAVVFLRNWRELEDRLFLWFALAFGAFAVNWTAIALLHPGADVRHWYYMIRLLGFVLILAAIVDKNRSTD